MEYAGMGRALERRRFEFLPETAAARRILILGEGDGRFLTELLRVNDRAEIDVVDNSAQMLAVALRRAAASVGAERIARQVRFHHADARCWPLPGQTKHYDLIVTHFFLDCFCDEVLHAPLQRWSAAATTGCRWIVSEFRQPARGFPAWRARLWIGALYRLFGWTTGLGVRRLPAYHAMLEKHGFRLARAIIKEMGLLTSELWVREEFLAFDAPADAPLHSRTPKS